MAATQKGMFTTEQAARFGVGKTTLRHLVGKAQLKHPGRGLYAVTDLVATAKEDWHRHVAHGATLLYDDLAFTSVTAVLVRDLPVWNTPLARPVLLRDISRGVRTAAFVVRPRAFDAVPTDWGPAVPVAQALVEHCLDHGIAQGVVSADAALHKELLTLDELEGAVAAVEQWPRSGLARSMLTFVNADHESVAESLTNVQAGSQGIELVPQVRIFDRDGTLVARVDFLVKGSRVIVEVDGRLKYTDQSVLFAEKKREDRLRALGYVVVRLTWADIMTSGRVAAKINAALSMIAA